MSDGPHYSLPMRKGWKDLAERADTEAFSAEEVSERLINALSQDWREEIDADFIKALRDALKDADQSRLFDKGISSDLDRLKDSAVGKPLAQNLVECAERVVAQGASGDDALEMAAQRALDMRIARGFRQVEEHYLRESTANRSAHVRERSELAKQHCDTGVLAKALVDKQPASTILHNGKKDGVDDGVPL